MQSFASNQNCICEIMAVIQWSSNECWILLKCVALIVLTHYFDLLFAHISDANVL